MNLVESFQALLHISEQIMLFGVIIIVTLAALLVRITLEHSALKRHYQNRNQILKDSFGITEDLF